MFNILNEEKLSTNDRKNLDSTMFGLPSDKKYPLTDEEHVRKAIQFFKFCPSTKKNELAKNINKHAKELNMTVNVGENNPFSKYASKDILTESSNSLEQEFFDMEGLSKDLQDKLNYLIKRPCYSDLDLITMEKYIHANHIIDALNADYEKINKGKKCLICPISILDTIMTRKYDEYMAYMHYETSSNEMVFYSLLKDIFFSILSKKENPHQTIECEIDILNDILEHTKCNQYYIYRQLLECKCSYALCKYTITDEPLLNIKNDKSIQMIDQILINLMKNRLSYSSYTGEGLDDFFGVILNNSGTLKTPNIENYLQNMKMEIEKQLYIISTSLNTSVFRFNNIQSNMVSSQIGLSKFEASDVANLLSYMEYSVRPENLQCGKFKDMRFQLNDIDIVKATGIQKYIETIYITKDMYGDNLYCGIKDGIVYLIASNINNDNIMYLIQVTSKNVILLCNIGSDTENFHIISLEFVEKNKTLNKVLTEGISIDGDGTIKFVLSSKKSYMDTYMENHKLLMENWKNKNLEGVKQNLAYAFALINIIERDKLYKSKDKEIIKARAFLTNDFKTYLKKLQEVEPKFDFITYYKESEYDKLIVNIPVETITGIKKIFQAIIG